MQAKEGFFYELLSGKDKKFCVPVYQRKYSWNLNNCKRFYEDLTNIIDKNLKRYYFGSIVFFDKNTGEYNSYSIIDGQQRITTILLFLKAIYSVVKFENKKNKNDDGSEIISLVELSNEFFYVNPYKPEHLLDIKLKSIDEDCQSFNDLFKKNEVNKNTLIGQNYLYFYNALKNKNINEIKSYYDAFKKLCIVKVSLDSDDDPQFIFESLNSTGLPLKESDKVRNYLLMNIDDDENKQNYLYNHYWKIIEENTGLEIDKFLKYYLTLKENDFIPDKKLYNYFREYCLNNDDITREDILKDLHLYSKYMKIILDANNYSKDNYLKGVSRLRNLDFTTITPIVFMCLNMLENNEISKKDVNDIINVLESFMFRRNVCNLGSAPLNKIFAYMPKEINALIVNKNKTFKEAFISSILKKDGNSRYPNNIEFKEAFNNYDLYNAKSGLRKYFFEMMENFMDKEYTDVFKLVENNTYTIEHVMPQNLSDVWKKELGEDYRYIHEKYLHKIGNLTLSAYNSEYSNLSFNDKLNLEINGIGKGFKYSKLYLNEYISSQEKWGLSEILERSRLLFDKAIKIWYYPETDEKDVSFNLFDSTTWDHVKITYFAKKSFDYILKNELIDVEEIERLKTLEYCKNVFSASYPVLAESRENHMKTNKKHYAKEKYTIHNIEVYLSFEWFDNQKYLLYKYVKTKLSLK